MIYRCEEFIVDLDEVQLVCRSIAIHREFEIVLKNSPRCHLVWFSSHERADQIFYELGEKMRLDRGQ